ncbi:unnamed protein product [Schistosoma margrebowiei]|uniref:Major facilitator superfamily (MFS) profile domain-containing protein n=1 Tax=Schistosoma margrebowiei TaxID=48269 RepID=A0AA85AEN6_9TREM|nr:unnamed protein product [Schistosoma margrebowiei]
MCSRISNYHSVLCVIGGIIIQCTYGYFYTIGNMAPYILDYFQYHNKSIYDNSIMWLTSVALGMEALAMPIGGALYRKLGIRAVVIISSLIHSGGITLSYYTLKLGFIPLLITYGVMQGFGFGFGYSATIAASIAWFQNNRGLIVGLIVGGFGAGPIIFTSIQTTYINPNNIKIDDKTKRFVDADLLNRVPSVFLLIGGVLLVIQITGLYLMRDKQKKAIVLLTNHDFKDPDKSHEFPPVINSVNLRPLELLKQKEFYFLWIIIFCAGIPLTSLATLFKLFGKTHINDDRFLAIMGVVAAVFNSVGRAFWGAISDRISFKVPLCIIFLCWSLLLTSFPHLPLIFGPQIKVGFGIWLCGLYLLISGVLVYAPTATETLFGPINMAVNYGLVFNAFVFGGLFVSLLSILIPQFHEWDNLFYLCAAMCILALLIVPWIHDRKMPKYFSLFRFYRQSHS